MSLPTASVTDFSSLASLRASARAEDPEALRKTAQQFEALFVQQLLKSARAAKLGDDVMGGEQMEFYQDLFDQQMSVHLSSGKGLGIADLLVQQLRGKTPPSEAEQALPKTSLDAFQRPEASFSPLVQQARAAADGAPNERADRFVDELRPHAERAARELGVPAEAILAQAALETGWGKRVPQRADGSSSHNYFGIKAHGWDGDTLTKTTTEHLGGRFQKVSAEFRAYDSPAQAFDDYVSFLKANPRYAEALKADTVADYAQGLQRAGYATDPAYADKLLRLARGERIGAQDL